MNPVDPAPFRACNWQFLSLENPEGNCLHTSFLSSLFMFCESSLSLYYVFSRFLLYQHFRVILWICYFFLYIPFILICTIFFSSWGIINSFLLFFLPLMYSIPFSIFSGSFLYIIIYLFLVRERRKLCGKEVLSECVLLTWMWICPGAQSLRQTHGGMAEPTLLSLIVNVDRCQKYKEHVNQGQMILPKEGRINTVKMVATESDIPISELCPSYD